jgi:hypothetical protein
VKKKNKFRQEGLAGARIFWEDGTEEDWAERLKRRKEELPEEDGEDEEQDDIDDLLDEEWR